MDEADNTEQIADGEGFLTLKSNDPASNLAEPDLQAIRHKVAESDVTVTDIRLSGSSKTKQARKLAAPFIAASVALALGTGAGYSLAARGVNSSAQNSNTSAIAPTCPPSNPQCNSGAGLEVAGKSASGISANRDSSFASANLAYYAYGQMWFIPSAELSDEGGQAPGYIFSTDGMRPNDLSKQLIAAFGIDKHTVTEDEWSINIKDADSDANLWLNKSDLNWSFDQQSKGPYACQNSSIGSSGVDTPDAGKGSSVAAQPNSTCDPTAGKVLPDDEAEAIAKEVFKGLGLAESDAIWSVQSGSDYFGSQVPYVHVTAEVLVAGQKSGLAWSADIAPDKSIYAASGYLSKVQKTADYETVGPKTAALRSHDLKWANFYGPQYVDESGRNNVLPMLGRGANSDGTSSEKDLDSAGRPLLPLSLTKAEITSATPGLIGVNLNQNYTLLPAYKLCGSSGCWLQVAVADKYVIEK
ncbi:MAG: hypothetical protein KGQ38_04040 [Actinomycetales bacterium]|nr:hypothetical protein [Actinomycetales bacterium]